MNVGDLVRHTKSKKLYTVVKIKYNNALIGVLIAGEARFFGSTWLEVVSSVLSDEQLENVIGGASPQALSDWRAEYLNESR